MTRLLHEELGLFGTSILTPQNVTTIVGNARILSDNIENYSQHPTRRVDLTAQVAHGVDLSRARLLLLEGLVAIPNVVREPAPTVEILEFNLAGAVLAVRPVCRSEAYWQVYFDTNRLIAESFSQAGFPPPGELRILRSDAGAVATDALRSRAAAATSAAD